jgi:hypothetical protein
MANYIDNGLLAVEKSLRDVVMLAVDPHDPLAREQLDLAIDYLAFLRHRVDYVVQRLRFELDHYRKMAGAVLGSLGDNPASRLLERLLAQIASVGYDPDEPVAVLRETVEVLAAAIDETVAMIADANPALRSAVERSILSATDRWIDLELSWYGPIAVDPDDPNVLPLDHFFPGSGRPAA